MTDKEFKIKMEEIGEGFKSGKFSTLIPLTFMLSFNGEPYSLDYHFQLKPLFKMKRAKKNLVKCARQVGKTWQLTFINQVRTFAINNYKTLYICPLSTQVERISREFIAQHVKHSPVKDLFVNKETPQNLSYREYSNNSTQSFSFASIDCERIRGYSGIHELIIDEVQDFDYNFIPVIEQVMSAVREHGYLNFSGTPKSFDSTIHQLWEESSQGELVFPCGCGKDNYAFVGGDLLKMIGNKGAICAKCGKTLDLRNCLVEHLYPERRSYFESLHISQITHPIQNWYPHKWNDVLYQLKTYPKYKAWNEILGESCDSATSLISITDLRAAGEQGTDNTIETAEKEARKCGIVVVAVDWGGGGNDTPSSTVISVLGTEPGTDRVRCLYTTRLPKQLDPNAEKEILVKIVRKIKPLAVCHDYGGGGNIRESQLIEMGWPQKNTIPFTYSFHPNQPILYHKKADNGSRETYMLDKTRSLQVLTRLLKNGKIVLPKYDLCKEVVNDFLNIREEKVDSHRGSDTILVMTRPKASDDFVHSLNFGCVTLWYMSMKKYPSMSTGEAGSIPIEWKLTS